MPKTNKPAVVAIKQVPATQSNVSVTYTVTQTGKNPFSLRTETTAKLSEVNLIGLARKIGYGLADSLHNLTSKAISAKTLYGKYQTAFRPKAVFKIEVAVNGVICFHALQTKGLDAIRLCDGKGNIFPRKQLVDKFELIAAAVEAANSFATALQWVDEVEVIANSEATKDEIKAIEA